MDQNRKFARDSRLRQKVMIEELQRRIIFFSSANETLKQQNDELSRLFMEAQNQAAAVDITLGQPGELSKPSASASAAVCVLFSLMARGEIMLCAKVCWWVGRSWWFQILVVLRHRFLLLVQGFRQYGVRYRAVQIDLSTCRRRRCCRERFCPVIQRLLVYVSAAVSKGIASFLFLWFAVASSDQIGIQIRPRLD
jgi:hypothetical protein